MKSLKDLIVDTFLLHEIDTLSIKLSECPYSTVRESIAKYAYHYDSKIQSLVELLDLLEILNLISLQLLVSENLIVSEVSHVTLKNKEKYKLRQTPSILCGAIVEFV